MLDGMLGAAGLLYASALARARVGGRLENSPYPSPTAADRALDALAAKLPDAASVERYGHSTQGRPLRLLRLGDRAAPARLLVTGQIHAGEFVAGYVARAVAAALVERAAAGEPEVDALLARSQVLVAPLLNPDGAERVWRRQGWVSAGGMRHTAGGVDPNRNFPFVAVEGRAAWNTARSRPGAAYYRGPHPLSEPECAALAALARRERFCAAIHFHSFGAVVFRPALVGVFAAEASEPIARAMSVFDGVFQSRQTHRAYRTIPERPAAIVGQLDAYLLGAFGTASATVEVGRPGLASLAPSRVLNPFWLANPVDPERWAANDVPAAIHALGALRDATGGEPATPRQPELAAF